MGWGTGWKLWFKVGIDFWRDLVEGPLIWLSNKLTLWQFIDVEKVK